MEVRKFMKDKVIFVHHTSTLSEAAMLLARYHIGTLPVVNEEGKLIGLLQLRNLLSLIMPDFIELVEDFDFVQDFGVLENRSPDLEAMSRPVTDVMEPPICVQETSGLLRAFSLLHTHHLADIPVINQDHILVGIASRVDVGTALLSNWGSQVEG